MRIFLLSSELVSPGLQRTAYLSTKNLPAHMGREICQSTYYLCTAIANQSLDVWRSHTGNRFTMKL